MTYTRQEMKSSSGVDSWMQWDPDKFFEHWSIAEVKRAEEKLLLDVEVKQEELRLMVGERYRDVLQASAAILSMKSSSQVVVDSMSEIQEKCSWYEQAKIRPRMHPNHREDSSLQRLQAFAAHIKLILDAPEYLWRLLERKLFLQAAWLFLLCRLVHGALTTGVVSANTGTEASNNDVLDEFPLVQRQWDTISHIKPQIIHRATLTLRDSSQDARQICAHLLTLHLLDSSSSKSAFLLYTSQRSKALQDSFESKQSLSEGRTLMSDIKDESSLEGIQHLLSGVRDSLLTTLSVIRDVFGSGQSGGYLAAGLSEIRSGQPDGTPQIPSTESVLQQLPSSTHLMLLPPSIRFYRPAVDTTTAMSAEERDSFASNWMQESLSILEKPVTARIERLQSIKQIWSVRRNLVLDASGSYMDWIGRNAWNELVTNVIRAHTISIWNATLDSLHSRFSSLLSAGVDALSIMTNAAEKDSAKFLFAPLSAGGLLKGDKEATMDNLRMTLRQRLALRNPNVNSIVSWLEEQANALHDELNSIPSPFIENLRTTYWRDSANALRRVLQSLDSHLVQLAQPSSNDATSLRASLFVGHMAVELGSRSSFLTTMHCSEEVEEELRDGLHTTHERTLEVWRAATLQLLPLQLERAMEPKTADLHLNKQFKHATYPSGPIVECCLELISSSRKLGIPSGALRHTQLLQSTLIDVVQAAVQALNTSGHEWSQMTPQGLFDLEYLKRILLMCEECGTVSSERMQKTVQLLDAFRARMIHHQPEDSPLRQPIEETVQKALLSSQLLLLPLIGQHAQSSPHTSQATRDADLLPDGPVELVRPSPRIGLVQV